MNLLSIRTNSQTLYAEKSTSISYITTTDWNQFINEGIKDMCTRGLIYVISKTATITTGVSTYTLPHNFLQAKSLMNASNVNLMEIHPSFRGGLYIVAGYPLYYYLSQTSLTYTVRADSTDYALGDYVIPAVANGYIYECLVAGTSGVAAPGYSLYPGSSFTDGTITWICRELFNKLWYFTLVDTPTTAGAGTGVYTLVYFAIDEGLYVDTAAPNFPLGKHHILCYFACYKAAIKAKNFDLAALFFNEYLAGLGLTPTQKEKIRVEHAS